MGNASGNGAAEERKERLRRRLVAARTLAGLGQKELADRIKAMGYMRGYSARTIGDMERGETPIQPQAIPVLAEACDLPPEFFTIDFEELRGSAPSVSAQLEELRAQQAEDAIRLAQLEEAVRGLAARDRRSEGEGGAQR